MKARAIYIMTAMLLAGCTSEWDMQGVDPKDFYEVNPIKNSVETRYETHTVHFSPRANRLAADDIAALRSGLRGISPLAAESVQVQVHPSQVDNAKRRDHITRFLRSMGYSDRVIMVEPSESLGRDDVQVNIAYAAVVPPHCPDWRTSPVTTYSNTTQGNFRCASVTNLGLMVADPRDLERGDGATSPEPMRNSKVILNYRAGADIGSMVSGASSAASASTGESASGSSSGSTGQ